ncbi:MAG TPA: glycosyltransferase [Dehalococcoidia bacterium]|nr:glycosyltransferase [Dehalococcoidia bacterium]
MKICYLANAASIHTQRWANYFAERDWKVDLITWHPPGKDAEINANIDVHRLLFPPHYIARYGALLEIALLIRRIHPDIIHAHYLAHFGILAGLYSRLSGFRPIVLTAWGSDVITGAIGWKGWLIKHALKRADLVTCDGINLLKALTEMGTEPKKIHRIHWGVDTQRFNLRQRSERIRKSLGILNSPVVISSKNLESVYDIESLVRSIPLVLQKVPEAKFVIAGTGSREAQLKQLVKSLGVSDSVRFVGFVPSDEFPKYLASADIYVCTSLSDGGLAIATKEAMACGLPVIVTDLEVNTEWIENGEKGFVVPLRNPEALAEKIIYLIEHEDMRVEFGKKGKKLVEERFEYNKEMQKIESIYEQLISEHKQRKC